MKYKDQGFKTHEKNNTNKYTLTHSWTFGKNFLIHTIDEVSTAITVKLQRHLYHHHEKTTNNVS